jgi:hypothetical protein
VLYHGNALPKELSTYPSDVLCCWKLFTLPSIDEAVNIRLVMDPSRGQAGRGQQGGEDLGIAGCSRTSGGSPQLGISMPRRGVWTARVRSSRGGSPAKRRRSATEKEMNGGCESLRHPSESSPRARLKLTCTLATQSSSRAPAAKRRYQWVTWPREEKERRERDETRRGRDEDETSPSRETRTRREEAKWQ